MVIYNFICFFYSHCGLYICALGPFPDPPLTDLRCIVYFRFTITVMVGLTLLCLLAAFNLIFARERGHREYPLSQCISESIHITVMKLVWGARHPKMFILVRVACRLWHHIPLKWRHQVKTPPSCISRCFKNVWNLRNCL